MKRIAIIPARGGSKGVPRKNVRMVGGKPLVAWNIEAAKRSSLIDQVVVSTDDPEIRSVSEQFGARVIQRPAEISGDTASSEAALLHVLHVLEMEGYVPDEIVFMQCTSPLTISEDIDNCIKTMEESGADSAFTAKEFFYFVWKRLDDGSAVGINHDKLIRPRRQDREPQYEENGAIYVMRTTGFLHAKHRFFGKTVMSLMPEDRSYEIDTEFDVEVVSKLIEERVAAKGRNAVDRPFPKDIKAIVFDFDGVMTDDSVWTATDGTEMVCCSRSDGQGISRAKSKGIRMQIISSEENAVVKSRAKKLGIEAIYGTGIHGKSHVLKQWLGAMGINAEEIVFMGNDLNDIECMQMAGFSIAPTNAIDEVKRIAGYVTRHCGGKGAVREALEFIVSKMH